MDNKINVLHFELSNSLGGIESFLFNVYKNINREKFHFDFVSVYENPALKNEFIKLGSNVYKVPYYKNIFSYYKAVNEIIKNKKYDVIHIHKNSTINIIPFLIAKLNKKPIIIAHSHNTQPSKKKSIKIIHYINRIIMRKIITHGFACSEVAAKWMYGKNYSTNDDFGFKLIKNNVCISEFRYDEEIRREIRKELNLKNETLLCHVGRFTEQKNHTFLIDLFNKYISKNKNSKLLLIGEGPLKNTIEDKVIKFGLEEKVIFLGARNDVNKLLQGADIFLLPSLYEGLPIVGIEAQVSGLPTITSDKVSKELKVTNLVEFVSLNDSISEWVKIIENKYSICNNRKEYADYMKKSGYDIISTVEILEDIYSNFIKKHLI